MKVWKRTPSFPSRESSALTATLNPSAVDGTTINFWHFRLAVRPPEQVACNQARKVRPSPKPEIKMVVLLGCSPSGRDVLATSAWLVVPSGLSLRGPYMSVDMRLLVISDVTLGSEWSESMSVSLSDPLDWSGATGPASTDAYFTPPSDGLSYRLPTADCSLVTDGTQRHVLDACLRAPSIRPSLPASWLCACPRAHGLLVWRLWPRFQMCCWGSQGAELSSSFVT